MLRQAMLNNSKDKGRKGLYFSQQKGKIMKNSRVGIFINQHMGITGTNVGQQGKTLMFWLVYVIYRQINLKGDFLMKNLEMTVEGETLIIKVDLSKDFGPSKSGKTIIIASTEGNVSVPERDEKIGLNVYRYPG